MPWALTFSPDVLAQLDHHVALLDDVTLTHRDPGNRAAALGQHGNLHFHRLHDHHRLSGLDGIALAHKDCQDVCHHLRTDLLGHRAPFVGAIKPRCGHTAAVTTRASELRPAELTDTFAIAALHRHAIEVCLPWLPRLHTPDEDLAFFRGVIEHQRVLVAARRGEVVGFAAWSDGWLNHLYVDPSQQRRRVGQTLLDAVIEDHDTRESARFQLWTFQRNLSARRFYEVNGLIPIEFTGGSNNEEGEPDIRYVRRPRVS